MTAPATPPSPSAPTAAVATAGTGESTPRVRATVAAAGVPNRLPMGGEVAAAPVPVRAAGRRNLLVEEPEVNEGVSKESIAVDTVTTVAPVATGTTGAAPMLLAQAETAAGAMPGAASGGAGTATAAGGTAAAGAVTGTVIGSTGWLVGLGAVGVAAVAASSNS
ncbi:MAG: hypothetical protein ACK5V7_17985, partial [bacterium]